MQGSRPDRVGEQIRQEVSQILSTEVRDPGVGLVTLTRVKVSPDLQVARIYYTLMGDEKAQKETARAIERATPFVRRQLGARLSLRRVPELHFHFDKSVGHQDRIEQVLLELEAERRERAADDHVGATPGSGDDDEDAS
jgi:ribosome-binding factor A